MEVFEALCGREAARRRERAQQLPGDAVCSCEISLEEGSLRLNGGGYRCFRCLDTLVGNLALSSVMGVANMNTCTRATGGNGGNENTYLEAFVRVTSAIVGPGKETGRLIPAIKISSKAVSLFTWLVCGTHLCNWIAGPAA